MTNAISKWRRQTSHTSLTSHSGEITELSGEDSIVISDMCDVIDLTRQRTQTSQMSGKRHQLTARKYRGNDKSDVYDVC